MENKPKKIYDKFKGQTPEQIVETRKKYRETYINKIGGIENYRKLVAKASLICYHKNKENGIKKINKPKPRKRDNLFYLTKVKLVAKIRELEIKLLNI